MPTLFTRIIAGEIPGRFVWSDEICVAILTIEPHSDGHALVIPRAEVDHWIEADPELLSHLVEVARRIGESQLAEFGGERAGLLIEGYGVPHLHLHVFASSGPQEFDPAAARRDLPAEVLDLHAQRLRTRLESHGHADAVSAARSLGAAGA